MIYLYDLLRNLGKVNCFLAMEEVGIPEHNNWV